MSEDVVLLERIDGVARIVLNRPEQRNALSIDVMERIISYLAELGKDDNVKTIIVKGNGPVFCAGHDLKEMMREDADIHDYRKVFRVCSDMMQMLHRVPQPVIAQVHGVATAAGCQLVAACDLAIAENGARFATPGVKIGLFCTTPMVPLVRAIGRRRAFEMLITGRFVSAQEAYEWGLVNSVVEPEELESKTLAFAKEIAQYSRFTLGLGKKAFYDQIDLPESAAYGYAQEIIAMNCTCYDAHEGITAFLEKRTPRWKNR